MVLTINLNHSQLYPSKIRKKTVSSVFSVAKKQKTAATRRASKNQIHFRERAPRIAQLRNNAALFPPLPLIGLI